MDAIRATAKGEKPIEVIAPKPVKHDVMDIAVHIDGEKYEMSFKVAMSTSLMGSQKNKARITEIIRDMIKAKFGKAEGG